MRTPSLSWVVVAAVAGACKGDLSTDDGGGPAGNVLANPSFEQWAGDDPPGWTVDTGTLSRTDVDPAHGMAAARVQTDAYAGLTQTWVPADVLPAGTTLVFTARVRWVEGDVTSPFLEARAFGPDGSEEPHLEMAPSLDANGGWVEASLGLVLEADAESVDVMVSTGQGGTPQTVDVDDTSLVVDP